MTDSFKSVSSYLLASQFPLIQDFDVLCRVFTCHFILEHFEVRLQKWEREVSCVSYNLLFYETWSCVKLSFFKKKKTTDLIRCSSNKQDCSLMLSPVILWLQCGRQNCLMFAIWLLKTMALFVSVFYPSPSIKSLEPFSLGNLPGTGLDWAIIGICVSVCVCVYAQKGKWRNVPLCCHVFLHLSLSVYRPRWVQRFPWMWDRSIFTNQPDKGNLAINYSNGSVCVCCVCPLAWGLSLQGMRRTCSASQWKDAACRPSETGGVGNESHPPLLPDQPRSFITCPCNQTGSHARGCTGEQPRKTHTPILLCPAVCRCTFSWPTFRGRWRHFRCETWETRFEASHGCSRLLHRQQRGTVW